MALDIDKAFDTTLITLGDEATGKATIIVGDFDPSTSGQPANVGSIFIRSDGTIWQKNGALDTDWGGGVGLDEFVKKIGDTMTGTLTMDASGGTVEVRIDNGSLNWGLGIDSGTGSPALVRAGVGGSLVFFENAVNPQILFGSVAGGTLNTFLDTRNGGGMRLNTLQTGSVVIGQGGLIPEQAGVNLGTATAAERWGDTFLSNTDVDGTLLVSGVGTIEGLGTGGLADIDLYVGDAVTTPTYGMLQIGNSVFGRTNFNAVNLDLDGTVLIWNMGTPSTSNIEFAFAESSNSIRFAIPASGAGNGTYNPRSLIVAGPAPLDDEMVTLSYWQGQGLFDNLAMDTGVSGADVGIQNDAEIEGVLYIDEIDHSTPATDLTVAALTIESNGTLNVSNVTNYELLVTGDDDIPNKKYVDDNGTTLTTIGGDLIPTFVDTGRGNKVLSTSEITYHFAENNVGNNDWVNPGAADADTSYVARKNGTIVGITGFCENAAVTKDIHLYIGVTDNGVIGTFTSGLLAQFNNNTNIDIAQGDRIRLRGDAASGTIEDTLIQLYVRWRG